MNIAFASITKLKEQQKECDWVDAAYQHYTKLLNDHSKAKDDFTTLNTKILLTEKDVEKGTQSLLETERKIELYHRNQIALENNQKINLIILTYKNTLNKLESTFNSNNKKLLELVGKEQVLKGTVQTVTETIQKMIDTEEKRELYEYYCRAVGRNGIPYVVICNTIPEITREINAILTQTTDFTVDIEYDEKNITPYVNYETKGRWVVESLSGFERVITSIAIRVALCNISNLPRNNFLIVDEGWGALDAHNLSSVPVLLSVLKSHFDFIIIISHLNVLRDYTDNQIEIKQIGNFSKVTF
jgi:DNA repair exonuclease SbcCD ATPase subunit